MTTICRHIKTNGERCGSPALRNHAFCYFHRNLTARHPKPAPDPIPTIIHPHDPTRELQVVAEPTLNLPPLEDRESIQLAASMIIGALARNAIDTRRATTLLYGLQVASANAVRLNHQPSLDYLVTEPALTPTGDEIPPDEDPAGELVYQEFLRDLEQPDDDDEEEAQDDQTGSELEAA